MRENMETTNEFSFLLKPSEHGIGVFAAHDIKKDAYLRLFGEQKARTCNKDDVSEAFRAYCIDRGETLLCPPDFGVMPPGWYLNHSNIPNAYHRDYEWYAARNIRAGEEITIDYKTLEEPNESQESYYQS